MAINPNIKDRWDVGAVIGNSALLGLAFGLPQHGLSSRLRWTAAAAVSNLARQTLLTQRKPTFWLRKGDSSVAAPFKMAEVKCLFAVTIGYACLAVWAARNGDDATKRAFLEFRLKSWWPKVVMATFELEVIYRGAIYEMCDEFRNSLADDPHQNKKTSQLAQALLYGLVRAWRCETLSDALLTGIPRACLGWTFTGQRMVSGTLWPSLLTQGVLLSCFGLSASAIRDLVVS